MVEFKRMYGEGVITRCSCGSIHLGGSLVFPDNNSNLAHCSHCNWQGVPTYEGDGSKTYVGTVLGSSLFNIVGSTRSTECPACESPINADYCQALLPNRWEKVGRNQQCPCGSGKKYKKCHGKRV